MDAADRHQEERRRSSYRLVLGGLVVALAVVGAVAVWYVRGADNLPVGGERAVTVEVDECGDVRVDVGRQRWSTMGAPPIDVVRAYGRGPEAGTLRRDTADEATFTSDLVGGSLTLRRHGREVFRTLGCAIFP